MRCPFADWLGPVPNRTPNGMVDRPHGLVAHVIVGSLASADRVFHQAAQQKSAHFGVAKDGRLVQWVDTDDKAWAQAAGNSTWWSAECEGLDTEPHTPAQIETLGRLTAWLHSISPFKLQVTDDVNGEGVISHRCGGKAWGAHTCPGDQRHAQRGEIVARAKALIQEADMALMVIDPKGADDLGRDSLWEVTPEGNVKNWNAARPLPSLSQLTPPVVLDKGVRIVAALPDPSGDGLVMVASDARQDERGHWVRSTYKVTVEG